MSSSKYSLIARDESGREVSLRELPESSLVEAIKQEGIVMPPTRRRLPMTRNSLTHKFSIAGHEGYVTVGLYEDNKTPGEMFITMSKEGSTVGGTMDAFGTTTSLCLQYGVPLYELVKKHRYSRFEPQGHTINPDIPVASSIVDYLFRWMGKTFLSSEQIKELKLDGGNYDCSSGMF